MKKLELQKLIKEEVSKVLKEDNTSLSLNQMKLLKELYTVIKNHYNTLSDQEILGTIKHLMDVYSK